MLDLILSFFRQTFRLLCLKLKTVSQTDTNTIVMRFSKRIMLNEGSGNRNNCNNITATDENVLFCLRSHYLLA